MRLNHILIAYISLAVRSPSASAMPTSADTTIASGKEWMRMLPYILFNQTEHY